MDALLEFLARLGNLLLDSGYFMLAVLLFGIVIGFSIRSICCWLQKKHADDAEDSYASLERDYQRQKEHADLSDQELQSLQEKYATLQQRYQELCEVASQPDHALAIAIRCMNRSDEMDDSLNSFTTEGTEDITTN